MLEKLRRRRSNVKYKIESRFFSILSNANVRVWLLLNRERLFSGKLKLNWVVVELYAY